MPGNQSKVYPTTPPSIHRQLTHNHFKWYYSYKTEGIRDIDIVISYNVKPLLHIDTPYIERGIRKLYLPWSFWIYIKLSENTMVINCRCLITVLRSVECLFSQNYGLSS